MADDENKRAKLPRQDDPLGFGLKSIPEPLQRWWLIGQGNPFFEEDCERLRPRLDIPESGFDTAEDYAEVMVPKRPLHGHRDRPDRSVQITLS
jgi:hypothetical protein